MRKRATGTGFLIVAWAAALVALSLRPSPPASAQEDGDASLVVVLEVQDAIGAATSVYIQRGLELAEERGAELVVLALDTPGGLDSAMRDIIQAILASPVPVATYVSPQGARAASAGTYILYASHVAAMAPATTTGAATPVMIGGAAPPSPPVPGDSGTGAAGDDEPASGDEASPPDETDTEPAAAPALNTAMERKAVNDAVSYIRGLAEQRGRNADWAERAVRTADSVSAQAALELNVIDVLATDLDDLARQIDGMTVEVIGGERTLDTRNAVFEAVEPDWRTRILSVLTNPEVAYMLLMLGVYGLLFEGYNPGAIVPGVVGAIALLLALFAFNLLPVNYAGLAFIVLGVILMAAEFLVPSFGALGFGGIAAFVFGSLILYDGDIPGFERPTGLVLSVSTVAGLGLLALVWAAMRARSRPVVSGVNEMLSATAEALEDFDTEGPVWVHGERWKAKTSRPVSKGQQLRITRVDGLSLRVEPVGPGRQNA
jgi:membrane-bound serine protease (ClpP class)